jgi:glucose/arabinose dehydrogenase
MIVVTGLDLPHGLAFDRGDLLVAETGRLSRFRYDVATRRASEPGIVVPDLPRGAHHWTRSVAVGPDGLLYVAVGSSCDACREADPRRAAITRYAPDGTGEHIVARGLRNPVGLAFQPGTGALWTTVNERDWGGLGAPPDFVTDVRPGARYGWPDCYAVHGRVVPDPERLDPRGCTGVTRPAMEVAPHAAPLGLVFYEGRQFPAEFRGDLFVAYHGSRPGLPTSGYKVVRVRLAGGRVTAVEDFVTGWRDGDRVHGRPVDLAVGADGALYISDDHGGRIYRVSFGD